MKIYLDVCCFNRPFDDHSQDRVRLESEAIVTILSYIQYKHAVLVGSEVVDAEISKMPEHDKKYKVSIVSNLKQEYVAVDDYTIGRAEELEKIGFKSFDALHIACAEKGGVDILLTTDDNFLSKAAQNKNTLKIRVEDPIRWLMEVFDK